MSRAVGMKSRAGWTRLSAPGDKVGATWRHDASGWLVRHCGHPTANWPYYAIDPAHGERRVVVSSGGLAFRRLADAVFAVEDVLEERATTVFVGVGRYGEVARIVRRGVA